MDEKTRYYKFIAGSVIVRRTGDIIEKKGKKGVWEDAGNLAWRFARDDDSLIEITKEEADIISNKSESK